MRTGRYLAEGARLAPGVAGLAGTLAGLEATEARAAVGDLLAAGRRILGLGGGDGRETREAEEAGSLRRLATFEEIYQPAKLALLRAGAERRVDVHTLDTLLTAISQARRMVEQIEKARVGLEAAPLNAGEAA